MEKRIYYLSNTVIPNTKREKNIHVFNVLTQVGVKQLTDFLRTVTAASDLVYCTLVTCEHKKHNHANRRAAFYVYKTCADPEGGRPRGSGPPRFPIVWILHWQNFAGSTLVWVLQWQNYVGPPLRKYSGSAHAKGRKQLYTVCI